MVYCCLLGNARTGMLTTADKPAAARWVNTRLRSYERIRRHHVLVALAEQKFGFYMILDLFVASYCWQERARTRMILDANATTRWLITPMRPIQVHFQRSAVHTCLAQIQCC
jgi:hypothetical protein